jgi:hypothetical protein
LQLMKRLLDTFFRLRFAFCNAIGHAKHNFPKTYHKQALGVLISGQNRPDHSRLPTLASISLRGSKMEDTVRPHLWLGKIADDCKD